MAWNLPVFNAEARVFHPPSFPPEGPNTLVSGQLYMSHRGPVLDSPVTPGTFVPAMYWRCPFDTLIFPGDRLQIPAGDLLEWYLVHWCEQVHLGFPNQYLSCLIFKESMAVPAAAPSPPPPPL